ncbi:hypothetical protein EGH25_02065 [Haladaptatus sp. F3-133]|uniref:DUF3892 domain-containing protein n=1 Tax=Halorutilus salinus TaxID=2487751 RepID=A0A9Q4C381_9EURY|nr:hypothetical protein [Halorutilus salinus]MCX2818140.1 hypothetical protein [Halorutilus salinus]
MGDRVTYAVTHVRYWDDDGDRLKHVKRCGIDIDDGNVGESEVARRRSVLFGIRSGDSHLTAQKEDGKLKLREAVEVVESDGGDWLRVEGDGTGDYLGDLPTF